MSQFSELYGTLLDIELGSADTTQLFTTVKRKDATNFGQREFVRLTRALTKLGTITLSDGVGEYDIEATITDFLGLNPRREVVIKYTDADGNVTYYADDDFKKSTKNELDVYNSGWRSADPGTPTNWYLEEDGGTNTIGITPAPDIAAGETWELIIPYIVRPTDMSADSDKPFTVGGDSKASLELYHQAIVHRAAAQLELLRKNYAASERQQKIFAGYVADYLQQHRTNTGHVNVARNYFGEVGRQERPPDPYR